MVSTSSQEVRLFLACRFVISVQLRQLPDHVGENAALFLQLGPPSTLILQDKTLFKGQKFENVRVSLSRGRETLWKQRFSKTMSSRQSRDFSDRVLLKHKSEMIGDCCVSNFSSVVTTETGRSLSKDRFSTTSFPGSLFLPPPRPSEWGSNMRDPGNEVGYSKLLLFSRNCVKDLRISAKFRYKQMSKLTEINQNGHLKLRRNVSRTQQIQTKLGMDKTGSRGLKRIAIF